MSEELHLPYDRFSNSAMIFLEVMLDFGRYFLSTGFNTGTTFKKVGACP